MQYMLMLYVDEGAWPKLTPERREQGLAAYQAYADALKASGALKGSGRLSSSASATTLRLAGGKPVIQDGPYADSKEQLGGYFLIDVPDLDAVLEWAAKCPTVSHGAVEVRPLYQETT